MLPNKYSWVMAIVSCIYTNWFTIHIWGTVTAYPVQVHSLISYNHSSPFCWKLYFRPIRKKNYSTGIIPSWIIILYIGISIHASALSYGVFDHWNLICFSWNKENRSDFKQMRRMSQFLLLESSFHACHSTMFLIFETMFAHLAKKDKPTELIEFKANEK